MVEPVPLRAVQRQSWIDRFVEVTEGIESPRLFRRWSAVAAVSGALERKCWSITWGTVYPNLFVVLTANPGIGKTIIIELVHRLWTNVKTADLNIAPTTVTKAALIDHYAQYGLRTVPGKMDVFHSCLIPARELGHLISEFDLPFLNTLNDFYDCNAVPYIERTRKLGEIKLQEPHMVMLAGAQPAWITSVFPEAAFAMGTASRIVFVYSAEITKAPLWDNLEDDIAVRPNPVKDRVLTTLGPELDRIAEMYGCFLWTASAKRLVTTWVDEGYPPVPQHHRLRHYATRRLVVLLKLAMVMSAAESSDLVIREEHVNQAMGLLFETETLMPEIFKEMSTIGGQGAIINDMINWMHLVYNKRMHKPIPEARLWEFLKSRLPASQIKHTIETLIQSNLIREAPAGKGPARGRLFVPVRQEELLEDD